MVPTIRSLDTSQCASADAEQEGTTDQMGIVRDGEWAVPQEDAPCSGSPF